VESNSNNQASHRTRQRVSKAQTRNRRNGMSALLADPASTESKPATAGRARGGSKGAARGRKPQGSRGSALKQSVLPSGASPISIKVSSSERLIPVM